MIPEAKTGAPNPPEVGAFRDLFPLRRLLPGRVDRLISLVQVEWFGLVPVTDEVDRIISVEVRRVCQQVDSSIQQRGGCGQLERTVDLVDDGDAGLLVQPHILLAAGGCGRAVRLRVVRMVAPMIILGAAQVCTAQKESEAGC